MKKAIKHELGIYEKTEIIRSTGISGYGVYWFLEEYIHQVRGNCLSDEEVKLTPISEELGITMKELRSVMKVCLRLNLFYQIGDKILSKALDKKIDPKLSEVRRIANAAGLKKRLENKKTPIKVEVKKNKEVKKNDKVKEIIFKTPPPKTPEPPKPDIPKLELILEEEPDKNTKIKEWEFLALFNELRIEVKPKARGMLTLSPTDKTNFKKLVEAGYTRDDFKVAIKEQLSSDYVLENGLDTPEHILRMGNFQRYISKSDKVEKKTNKFVNKETNDPDFK